jgi:hypothetical protein
MANFTYFIRERVKLNGVERGTNVEVKIPGINYSDNRVMTIPSGSITEIINVDNLPGAGTFVSSSIKYARITNHATSSINLEVSGSTSQMSFLITGSGSFMFSTEFVVPLFNEFIYNDLRAIKATALTGGGATLSYFIALT